MRALKLAVLIPTAAATVALTASAAFAGNYVSTVYQYTINSRVYDGYSILNTDAAVTAKTEEYSDNFQNVASQHMGVQPRLFAANGTLCNTVAWTLNASPTYYLPATVAADPGHCSGATSFYAYGLTETYNGSGMSAYYTNSSGTYAGHTVVRAVADRSVVFPRNAAGLTYGSGLKATSPSNEPDLLRAQGRGNVLGYVRSADLLVGSGIGLTLQQIRALVPSARTIPLYAQDGATVVGTFDVPLPVG